MASSAKVSMGRARSRKDSLDEGGVDDVGAGSEVEVVKEA
jgi:hypothetical protein